MEIADRKKPARQRNAKKKGRLAAALQHPLDFINPN